MLLETTTDSYQTPPPARRDLAFNLANEQANLVELSTEFKNGLADNLTHYLAEFILRLPIAPYYYRESEGDDGEKRLTSPGFGSTDILTHFGQPYLIKSGLVVHYPQAIESLFEQMPLAQARESREAAEAKGFAMLRQQIFDSPDGTLVGLVSPPINPDGYSITYLGQVKPAQAGRLVEMAACFNHLTLENHQEFLKLLGKDLNLGFADDRAEDFLLSPFTITPKEQSLLDTQQLIDLVLRLYAFDPQAPQVSKLNFSQAKQTLKQIRQQAVQPHLDKFIDLLIQGANKPQIDALLDKIELSAVKASMPELMNQLIWKMTDERDRDLQALAMLVSLHRDMPKDGGSCPAVNRNRDNLMTSVNELINVLGDNEDEPQKCENCERVKDLTKSCCQHCRFK